MKILYENAASVLLEKVKSMNPGPTSSWRCIHLRMAGQPDRYNWGLRAHFVARALIQRLSDLEGYMFLCEDGDIFILFQGPLKSVMGRLTPHFDDIASDLSRDVSVDSRFAIYDLGTQYHNLLNISRDKVINALLTPASLYSSFGYSLEGVM